MSENDNTGLPQENVTNNVEAGGEGLTLDNLFEKELGVPLQQAMDTYNRNYILTTLGDAWDVSPKAVNQRIETVKSYVEKLQVPDEQKQAYTSIEGVQKAWNEIQQLQQQGNTAGQANPYPVANNGFLGTNYKSASPKTTASQRPTEESINARYEKVIKDSKENFGQNLAAYAAELQAIYFDKHLRG